MDFCVVDLHNDYDVYTIVEVNNMCTPIEICTGDVKKLQTKTNDLKSMANMKVERNKKATKFAQELFFNAVMGVSLVALIFGFVILIKVLIG